MDIPQTLQEAIQYFSDEQVCIDAVAMMRWPEGPRCPDCHFEDAKNPYYIKTQKRWKCRTCRRQFSVKVETIFEDSPVPLEKWLPATWMLVNCKNGISSWELHRAIGVTQKTAWFMLQRIRLASQDQTYNKLMGEVERCQGKTIGQGETVPPPMAAEQFEASPEFRKFKSAMRKILKVPKAELNHRVRTAKERSPRFGNPRAPGRKSKNQNGKSGALSS